MRKTLCGYGFDSLIGAAVTAQQHAAVPKETQCHADAQAWIISKAELAKLPMQELGGPSRFYVGLCYNRPGLETSISGGGKLLRTSHA